MDYRKEFGDIFNPGSNPKRNSYKHYTHDNSNKYDYCYGHQSNFSSNFKHLYTEHSPKPRKYDQNISYEISRSTLRNPCQTYPRHQKEVETRTKDNKDASSLPYYIVPVLYVPHKPLYEAKQLVEPQVYHAYHCRSKKQLSKNRHHDTSYKLNSKSQSMLNIFDNKEKMYDPPPLDSGGKHDYSFDYYDRYFKKYIEGKGNNSPSDISFCTEKSQTNFACQKTSTNFDRVDLPIQKPNFGLDHLSFYKLKSIVSNRLLKNNSDDMIAQPEPIWNIKRDAFIETESPVKSSVSIQTLDTILGDVPSRKNVLRSEIGTQTIIKDIKKCVLVMPSDKVSSDFRKENASEEIQKDDKAGELVLQEPSEKTLSKLKTSNLGPNRTVPNPPLSKLTKPSFGTGPLEKASKKNFE